MKYRTPELTALAAAINAIQGVSKPPHQNGEGPDINYEEPTGAYESWED